MAEPLTLEDAAALLGVAPQDLMLSRARGLEPGVLGYRQGGVVLWDPDVLAPFAPKPKPKASSKPKTNKK
jgi:hypothetical protein